MDVDPMAGVFGVADGLRARGVGEPVIWAFQSAARELEITAEEWARMAARCRSGFLYRGPISNRRADLWYRMRYAVSEPRLGYKKIASVLGGTHTVVMAAVKRIDRLSGVGVGVGVQA